MDDSDYMDKVKDQIELDKLLYSVKLENKEMAKTLFYQKKEIIKKNGFFTDWQLKRINQKIERLKK
ncbi:MAG: hypothetical protein IJ867_03670 [Clostridia bacterium]|nr:hypothetical protein [Clostridia bacterium]